MNKNKSVLRSVAGTEMCGRKVRAAHGTPLPKIGATGDGRVMAEENNRSHPAYFAYAGRESKGEKVV